MLGATKYTDHFNKESIDYRKRVRAAIRELGIFETTSADYRNKRMYGYTDKYTSVWLKKGEEAYNKLSALSKKLGFYVRFGYYSTIIYMPNQPST
jgi:hypothetical protein